VLRPLGARFVPPESGCEGGPDDRIVVWPDGARETVQVKAVRRDARTAGFRADMHRCNGSTRRDDGSKQMEIRPYSVEDGVDRFLFVLLDDEGHVAEYWAATTAG
jgi:hypothetical protein